MQPPRNYDALRQAEQQAKETPQLDSAKDEPTRPTEHPSSRASYTDRGEPVLPVETRYDAAEIARAAKERADANARAREQERDKGGHER